MDYVLNLGNREHLQTVIRIPIKEVVIQTKSFSLNGGISDADLHDTLNQLTKHRKLITLQWDMLCQDDELETLAERLTEFSSKIMAIRFVDPGVGAYLKKRFQNLHLQFLMWDGHQNRAGILKWIQIFQPNLHRIILSNQISKQIIKELRQSTGIPIEIKGLGRVQLFYSPRKLLSNNSFEKQDDNSEILAASTDRPTQFFSVQQTHQGTTIFNDKDLYLLDRLEEIKTIGVNYLGLEPHTSKQYTLIEETFGKTGWIDKVKNSWENPLIDGFFSKNQTDSLLARLSNTHLKGEKQYQIGSVIESLKNSHTLLHLKQDLDLPQQVVFITPERKEVKFEITHLIDLKGRYYQDRACHGLYRLPWIKYVVSASIMKSNTSI